MNNQEEKIMNNQHQKHCRADKGYKCSCFPSSEIDFMNNPPAQDQPVTPEWDFLSEELREEAEEKKGKNE